MVINAISPLGARLLEKNRTRETGAASRTRGFMSIRATHSAAYNASIGDEAEADDSPAPAVRGAAVSADRQEDDPVQADDTVFAANASSSVSRQIRTRLDAEDAYASN